MSAVTALRAQAETSGLFSAVELGPALLKAEMAAYALEQTAKMINAAACLFQTSTIWRIPT